jgi:hypothetical protein
MSWQRAEHQGEGYSGAILGFVALPRDPLVGIRAALWTDDGARALDSHHAELEATSADAARSPSA